MFSLARKDFIDAVMVSGQANDLYMVKQRGSRMELSHVFPASGKRAFICTFGTPRLNPALAYQDGSVYILGGTDLDEMTVYAECEIAQVPQGGVSYLPDLVFPRAKASAVFFSRDLYVFGGYQYVRDGENSKIMIGKTIERLARGNWVVLSLILPIPLARATPSVVENRLFLIGGISSAEKKVKSVFEVSVSAGKVRIPAEAQSNIEEGYPVSVETTRSVITFTYRRAAETRTAQVRVVLTDWELRRSFLYVRFRLQRLILT